MRLIYNKYTNYIVFLSEVWFNLSGYKRIKHE